LKIWYLRIIITVWRLFKSIQFKI